jgi:hypothetical protein
LFISPPCETLAECTFQVSLPEYQQSAEKALCGYVSLPWLTYRKFLFVATEIFCDRLHRWIENNGSQDSSQGEISKNII